MMTFKENYAFLSNMYPCNVTLNVNGTARKFCCAESAYQAMKEPERVDKFTRMNGYDAKRAGKTLTLRDDWNDVRLDVMREIVRAKFTQNPWLLAKLRTVTVPITENNTWNDTFWGVCRGVGENHLGKILMEVRDDNTLNCDIERDITMCFTGRRPKDLCGYDSAKYNGLVDEITNVCEGFYQQGIRRYISGGAQGFDQLSFWAVHRLKTMHPDVKNIVYVPFKGQERQWAKKGAFSQNEYNKMLSVADEIVYVTEDIDLTSFKNIATVLNVRNEAMVDSSRVVLGLYPDYTWSRGAKGGTANCMRYANTNEHCDLYQMGYHIKNNELTDICTCRVSA